MIFRVVMIWEHYSSQALEVWMSGLEGIFFVRFSLCWLVAFLFFIGWFVCLFVCFLFINSIRIKQLNKILVEKEYI